MPDSRLVGKKTVRYALAIVVLIAAVFILLMFPATRIATEKTLTLFVLPVGFFALVFVAATAALLLRGNWRWGFFTLLVTVVYWLLASPAFGYRLMTMIERVHAPPQIESMVHLDYLIVLGGGAIRQRGDVIKIGPSGDRIVLAARLWHAGKVSTIVTSGSGLWAGKNEPPRQADAAAQILRGIGVPAASIQLMSGRNTSEEIASVEKLLSSLPLEQHRHVGLLTSAWHLPRAMRLANERGLTRILHLDDDFSLDL